MTNKQLDNNTNILDEPIAIIGANCQFPGINQDIEDIDSLYAMLLKEQTPIKEVPINRWDIDNYYDPDRQKEDKIVSRKGGFMEDPRLFDASFFNIPPVEAKQIDPQHRLFLEVAIRALNDANITIDSLKNSNTGVYCGLSTHEYSQLNYKDKISCNAYTNIGSADSAAAGRLSYFLNLKGPCITVDTACSSSLSALYLATTALRTHQCDIAIIGGVHLNFSPEAWIGFSKAKMLSAIGESRSFDAGADGYARSEGCAVVIIKRLSDAIKDKNKIHAITRSIIMNQNGDGAKIAAPNIEAQIAMHHALLEEAHLTASDIDYIEAHGAGTALGDAVELQAIQSIHRGKHSQSNPLVIGAIKSNLGHTISVSGLAALLKVISSFKHEMIPANIHYATPNNAVDLHSIPALIPVKAKPFLKQQHKKRYVQIANFGFTGTNVSAIIEEPPRVMMDASRKDNGEAICFVFSANSKSSLHQLLEQHWRYLKATTAGILDIAYTLINCRDHFKFRCAIIAQDKESLIKKMESSDYAINKVSIKKEITYIENDAATNSYLFLSGANIRTEPNKPQFNLADLPLYVFDRKVYWHNIRSTEESIMTKDWCFQIEWHSQPTDANNYKKLGHRWLLIGAEQEDLGLKASGLTIVRETEHYLLDMLDGIIVAEGFDPIISSDIDARVDRQKHALKKILSLVKQLNKDSITLQLVVLTANNTGKNNVNLDNSPLKGFCKTLCLELPQYQTILLDVDQQDKKHIAEHIIAEMHYNHGASYEHVVTYRGGQRLVSRLTKLVHPKEKAVIQSEGRYLITGGCGGLGLVTSQALLAAGARELVLVSRTVDKPSIVADVAKLELDFPDAIIRLVSLDISDKVRLQQLLLEINADGLLKGIIHAAGASMNKSLLEHNDHDVDYLFSAKVKGGWYLHELSQDCTLDFFVVYSSIAAVFGSNKESIYSATNSFLDGLIEERQRLGLVGNAIQWGPWAEVGMAEKRSRDRGLKEALIHNDQGKAFIQRLINSPLRHATVISPKYLQFMLDFVPEPRPLFYKYLASELTEVEPSSNTTLSPWLTEYSKLDAVNQLPACIRMITQICKELMELTSTEDVDKDAGFFEIGFDSLMIAALAARLKINLNPLLPVPATIAFDYPSIHQLSEHIQNALTPQFLKTQNLNKPTEDIHDAIAIIGMSCSFPNAPDIAAFEQLLECGLSGIRDIPNERWDHRLYYDPNPDAPEKTNVKKLGLIDHIKFFDPQFFGISPREARFMDPQQRLFLENCYLAIEYANYSVNALRGSATGVFAGAGPSQYYNFEEFGLLALTGRAMNIIPGRVTYTFDFKGPALTIDTGCSSSLVALHYACNSLRNQEIDYALAGGVNVILRPEGLINLSKAKALSPDGQCKSFDEHADGYVRSEGCGVVFLKRMADALRDKDTILAVIKGSAINNDGKSAGLTVPNGKSQENVMRKALKQSQLSSSEISYIEAHGTGTSLGDPIEVHAINAVYGQERFADNPLYIGTAKTNIGHLESAAGIAGLIKVIIGFQKNRLYKHLNFNRLNPHIKLDQTRIALHTRDWQSQTKLRAAGVNAYGFSGTNVHIVLQEFQDNQLSRNILPPRTNALLLSAKSQIALDNLVVCYQKYLATTTDDFNNVCFTAAVCRAHYPFRLAVVAKDALTASELLRSGRFCENNSSDLNDCTGLTLLVMDYLQGKQIDWASYYKTMSPDLKKIRLPNYPFDRKEYWLDKGIQNAKISPSTGEKHSTMGNAALINGILVEEDFVSFDTASEHLYEIRWSASPLNSQNLSNIPDLWVISTNAMRAEKIFGQMNYKRIDSIDELESVENKNIVFLYEEDQFYALFYCCQRMFKSLPNSFILVTENAYAIHDSAPVNPHHTMACSFWKSFKNELEFNKNYAIDLGSQCHLSGSLEYVLSATNEETQFAVRDAIYLPRIQKKKLNISTVEQKPLFDREATYLITGGTGGLAKPLMEYLIRKEVKHIVITSRSECSRETQDFIESARKQDVIVRHYSADAGNVEQMKAVIDGIQQGNHALKGVFHLAGVTHDDLIVNLDKKDLQQVFRPKMEGALILHLLTNDIALDMFVLFSSVSSILGTRRHANYVAANGFLDGLAYLRYQQGLPALVINWGTFRNAGMAAEQIGSLKKRGFIPLDEHSINLLDVLLRSNLQQIIVCPMHWDLYFKNTRKYREIAEKNESIAPLSDQPLLPILQQHTSKEQSDILSQALCDIAADVLGLDSVEQLNKNSDLFALGMDSLMSLEIRSRFHDKLQCPNLNLPIEYFINDSRIDKITAKIVKSLSIYFAQHQTNQLADNVRIGSTTLCDTQYGFWLVNKKGYSYNCPIRIQLYGKLNQEYLSKALADIVNKHSAFWLDIDQKLPIQMVKRQGQFSLIYNDLVSIYDRDILNDVFIENTLQNISLTEPPLIKAYLYKLQEELHELHIIIPHIIFDGASLGVFFEQLKGNYDILRRGGNLFPTQEQYGYLDYVKQANSYNERDIQEKIDFWRVYNSGFQKLNLGHANHLPDAAFQSKNLFHYPLDNALVNQFKQWHKERNINVSTGLIAALHLVFYKINNQKKIPIMVLHNDREGSRYDSIIGLMLEYKRVNIILNEHDTFMEFFKSIEHEFIKVAPFQKCSQYIKNIGLQKSSFSIGHKLAALYYTLFMSKKIEAGYPNIVTRPYYLKALNSSRWRTVRINFKDKINQLLHINLKLLKPKPLAVVYNITSTIFDQKPYDNRFSDLTVNVPNHYRSVDRPIGNETLWIFFTKDSHNQYRISINGPLTTDCKDRIAHEFMHTVAKIMGNVNAKITDLIQQSEAQIDDTIVA